MRPQNLLQIAGQPSGPPVPRDRRPRRATTRDHGLGVFLRRREMAHNASRAPVRWRLAGRERGPTVARFSSSPLHVAAPDTSLPARGRDWWCRRLLVAIGRGIVPAPGVGERSDCHQHRCRATPPGGDDLGQVRRRTEGPIAMALHESVIQRPDWCEPAAMLAKVGSARPSAVIPGRRSANCGVISLGGNCAAPCDQWGRSATLASRAVERRDSERHRTVEGCDGRAVSGVNS